MKTMILCAGLGTRLKPWTEKHPKALVPVGGIPMLKRVSDQLIKQGFDEITINIHHFGDQIVSFVSSDESLLSKVTISDETVDLLETGGGILNAEEFLAKDNRPFLVHNVDILSNADLRQLYADHVACGRDITLLVSDRKSNRKLVFDGEMQFKGWTNMISGEFRPANLFVSETDKTYSFSSIHVMNPSGFDIMKSYCFSG